MQLQAVSGTLLIPTGTVYLFQITLHIYTAFLLLRFISRQSNKLEYYSCANSYILDDNSQHVVRAAQPCCNVCTSPLPTLSITSITL